MIIIVYYSGIPVLKIVIMKELNKKITNFIKVLQEYGKIDINWWIFRGPSKQANSCAGILKYNKQRSNCESKLLWYSICDWNFEK